MTLSARTYVLHIAVILSLILLAVGVGGVVMILRQEAIPQLLFSIERARSWFGLTVPMDAGRVFLSLVTAVAAPFLALLGLLLVEQFFRRTLSPQVFFFSLFLLGFAFEAGRAAQAYFFVEGVPYAILSAVTRFVAFGRIIAMTSLVAASLYAAGISYQKNGVVLAIIVAIGGGVSYASPVNTLIIAPDLLFRLGEGYSVDMVHLILGVVAVINYAQASYSQERSEHLIHAVALLSVVVGWLLLIELPLVVGFAGGAALLLVGSGVFLKRRYSSYLWS